MPAFNVDSGVLRMAAPVDVTPVETSAPPYMAKACSIKAFAEISTPNASKYALISIRTYNTWLTASLDYTSS